MWFFVLSMIALCGWIIRKAPMANSANLLAGFAFIVQGVLKMWVLSETCTRFVEDRRAGAYELLLCAPVTVRQVARGHALALWRQLGWPVLFMLGCEWWLARSFRQPMARWYFGIPSIVFVPDLAALYQIGRWRALFTNSITRAWLQTALRVLVLPWLIYLCYHALVTAAAASAGSLGLGPSGVVPPERNFLVWLGICLAVDLALAPVAAWRFFHQFRDIAAARFTAKPEAALAALEADAGGEPVARSKRLKARVRRFALACAAGLVLFIAGRHLYS